MENSLASKKSHQSQKNIFLQSIISVSHRSEKQIIDFTQQVLNNENNYLYAELVSKVSIKKTELIKRLSKRKSQLHNLQIKQFEKNGNQRLSARTARGWNNNQLSLTKNQNNFLTSLNESKVDFIPPANPDENYQNNVILKQIQHEQLKKQFEELNNSIRNIQEKRTMIIDQLRLFQTNQQNIYNTMLCSKKDNQQMQLKIISQKKQNQLLDLKIQEQIDKLEHKKHKLKEGLNLIRQCFENSDIFNQSLRQNQKDFVQEVQQKEQDKSNNNNNQQHPCEKQKQIYSKLQLEESLRSLYLIIKLKQKWNLVDSIKQKAVSEKVIDPKLPSIKFISKDNNSLNQSQQQQSQAPKKVLFFNMPTYKELFEEKINWNWRQSKRQIQDDLDPIDKVRLLCKNQIIQKYDKLFKHYESESFVDRISEFYQILSNRFDRTERVNFQLTQVLNQLRNTQEELNVCLNQIEENKTKNTMKFLEQLEDNLKKLQNKINNQMHIIFQFNILTHQLIKKINNVNRTFDKIMKKSCIRIPRKTFIQFAQNYIFDFQRQVERSPQQVLLQWKTKIFRNGRTKTPLSLSIIRTSKGLPRVNSNKVNQSQHPSIQLRNDQQGQQYLNFLQKSDLLRVLAKPQFYDCQVDCLQNQKITYEKVFEQELDLIVSFSHMLNQLLQDPLIRIRQLQKQFHIKPKINTQRSSNNFCVQSKQFYRRDDFKLLEKLERIQLKKKGLYYFLYFSKTPKQQQMESLRNQTREVEPRNSKKLNYTLRELSTSERYRSQQNKQKFGGLYTNQLSQKRSALGSMQRNIRKALDNVSHITANNFRYRIKKQRQTTRPKFFHNLSDFKGYSYNGRA